MKHMHTSLIAIALTLSTNIAFSQENAVRDDMAKSVIKCHTILFSLALIGKVPFSENESSLIERMRKAIPRVITESKLVQVFPSVLSESQNQISEITSDGLTSIRAKEIKMDSYASCVPVLTQVEAMSTQ